MSLKPIESALQDLGVELTSPDAGAKPTRSMLSRRLPLAPPEAELRLLAGLDLRNGNGEQAQFETSLTQHGIDRLPASAIEIFQINLGKLCNMTCRHCHVDAGPDRTDSMMSRETLKVITSCLPSESPGMSPATTCRTMASWSG